MWTANLAWVGSIVRVGRAEAVVGLVAVASCLLRRQ